MKKVRLMTTAALVAIAGFTTISLTSCTKDDVVCAVGLEGKNCDQEVREKYYNTYRGDGVDSWGDTYTNWAVTFSARGTDPTAMKFELLDETNATLVRADANLKTNTTFKIDETTMNNGATYTGNGTVDENSASITLKEVHTGITTTYTFNNLSR